MKDKTFETNMEILKDTTVENEVKTYVILEMYANQEITLHKAKELFTEIGVFTEHWMAVDGEATNLFIKHMNRLGVNSNE